MRQGINVQDIIKLKAAGIVTILGVAQTPRKNLLKLKVCGRDLLIITTDDYARGSLKQRWRS
jgi:hypothetical protein